MEAQHFLTTRWRSGYFAVSQVPPRVTVLLEEIRRPFEQSVDETARIFVTRIEDLGTIGTLFGKVYLNTDRRRATFQHSVLVPDVAATEALFLSQFRSVYGRSPDRALYVLSNLLSTREHWEGSPLVRAILFGEIASTDGEDLRISKAGALVRAVLDQWPEALRVLPDVGVHELDQITGGSTGPITTDPPQPAITEISEEFTEEVTSAIHAMGALGIDGLRGLPAASAASEPARADGPPLSAAETELLRPSEEVATQLQPREEASDPASGADTAERPPNHVDEHAESSASAVMAPHAPRRPWWMIVLFFIGVVATVLVLQLWSALNGAPPDAPPSGSGPATAVQLPPPQEPTPTVQHQGSTDPPSAPQDTDPDAAHDAVTPADLPRPPEPAHAARPAARPDATPCFIDNDEDGYGDQPAEPGRDGPCKAKHLTTRGGDCDDTRRWVYPGAPELCDRVDNDCDGVRDDNLKDANHNGKDDCREGREKWKTMELKDRTLRGSEWVVLSVDLGQSGCEQVRAHWKFQLGSAGQQTFSLEPKGGKASCTIPFKTDDGEELVDQRSSLAPRCGNFTYNTLEKSGDMTVWWDCCLEREAQVASGVKEMDCETDSDSRATHQDVR